MISNPTSNPYLSVFATTNTMHLTFFQLPPFFATSTFWPSIEPIVRQWLLATWTEEEISTTQNYHLLTLNNVLGIPTQSPISF